MAAIPIKAPTFGDTTAPKRRSTAIAGTLVVGTALLAATLAARAGSGWFYALGFLSGITWIAGALVSGLIPWRRHDAGHVKIAGPTLLGVGLFGVFFAAKLLGDQIRGHSRSHRHAPDLEHAHGHVAPALTRCT